MRPLAALAAPCGALLAAALHPALPAAARFPLATTSALALLFVLALAAGSRSPGGRLVAAGALVLAVAVGYDGLRGHEGTVTLERGEAAQRFEEEGPGGRPLGLRPLGFDVLLERLDPSGGAALRTGDGQVLELGPRRAAAHGGLRFGVDGPVAAEGSTLRISVARAGSPRIVDLQPGETAEADGLRITLESYFPDFALDKNQQPYTRSDEPRNPAALLQVARGGEHWRVFVIQAMPGIHRPQGLDHVLSLIEVVSRRALRIRVSRQPAAPLALAGVLVSVLGLARPFRAA